MANQPQRCPGVALARDVVVGAAWKSLTPSAKFPREPYYPWAGGPPSAWLLHAELAPLQQDDLVCTIFNSTGKRPPRLLGVVAAELSAALHGPFSQTGWVDSRLTLPELASRWLRMVPARGDMHSAAA